MLQKIICVQNFFAVITVNVFVIRYKIRKAYHWYNLFGVVAVQSDAYILYLKISFNRARKQSEVRGPREAPKSTKS